MERAITPGDVHTYPLDLAGDQTLRMIFVQNLRFDVTVRRTK